MDAAEFNKEIEAIINGWCDRRDLRALSFPLLAAWLENNNLTDGWENLAKALRSASNSHSLPSSERDKLKRLWIEVDVMLRNR